MTQDQQLEVIRAQLDVLAKIAALTANTADDFVIGILKANEPLLLWLADWFMGGGVQTASAGVAPLGLPAGIDWSTLLPFLIKYGPLLMQLIKAIRGQG